MPSPKQIHTISNKLLPLMPKGVEHMRMAEAGAAAVAEVVLSEIS